MILTENVELMPWLTKNGYRMIANSPTKNLYSSNTPDELLVVFKDNIKLFNFVLGSEIPRKGEVNAALNHFWVTRFSSQKIGHNLVLLPSSRMNKINRLDLQIKNGLIVEKEMKQYKHQLIFRKYLDKEIYNDYCLNHRVCGQALPNNLKMWDELDKAIFTPRINNKNIGLKNFFVKVNTSSISGDHSRTVDSLQSYFLKAYNLAKENGILILKTEFNISESKICGDILNIDSTIFCDAIEYQFAIEEDREPESFVTEPLKEYFSYTRTPFNIQGLQNLDPLNELHVAYARNLVIPKKNIDQTYDRLLTLFNTITGYDLNLYQEECMGIL